MGKIIAAFCIRVYFVRVRCVGGLLLKYFVKLCCLYAVFTVKDKTKNNWFGGGGVAIYKRRIMYIMYSFVC